MEIRTGNIKSLKKNQSKILRKLKKVRNKKANIILKKKNSCLELNPQN